MKLLTIIVFLISATDALSQNPQDTVYRFEIHSTLGPLFSYFDNPRYAGAPDNIAFGYGANLRVMWHPGRLLAMGIMSGYSFISLDKFTIVNDDGESESISAQLEAIPLQAIFSMQTKGFEFGLGIGSYLMMSTLKRRCLKSFLMQTLTRYGSCFKLKQHQLNQLLLTNLKRWKNISGVRSTKR